jgi:hypothetical protein
MELIDIFVDDISGEGIYAMRWGENEEDEFERNLNLWADPECVIDYLEANKDYLQTEYFEDESIETIARKIEKEALELEALIFQLAEAGFADSQLALQNLFKPLENTDYVLYVHQESKAVISDHHFPKPILRFYAIRISPNTYVITGGAIKLTHEMKDHDDTKQELAKLKKTRAFLIDNNLLTGEEIKTFLYEQL